jgi:hypothetical protein
MTIIYIDDKAVPLIEGGGGGGGCFASDTLISIEDGQKQICDIEVGDKVWAYDEIGQPVLSFVTETFYHQKDKIYRVNHETGNIDITLNHWVLKEDGEYQEMGDFVVGDRLLTTDNQLSKINSIEFLKEEPVYNFKVSHLHSYIANGIKVHNGGGGGKSGGGGGTESPNNLFSTDVLFLQLGLGEGPIYRINPNGPQDIEFNEGLIDDLLINGLVDDEKFFTFNNTGTISQQPLPLFGDFVFVPQRLSGATELKKGNLDGVARSSVDKQNTSPTALTAIKFYFTIGGIQKQNSNGDILGSSVTVKATVYDRTGTTEIASRERTISGKTNVAYSFDLFLAIPVEHVSDAGYLFTVEKTSTDNASSKVQENVSFQGWTEVIETPIGYVRTATVGYALKAFAEHKGSMPAITQMVKGLLVKVPSNYNQPILENGEIDWREVEVSDANRSTYQFRLQKTGPTLQSSPLIYDGLWDGQFVYSWTQNPVWIVYDMLTNSSYGLGIPEDHIDRYSFYDAAVYCDACDITTGIFQGADAAADGTYRNKPRTTKSSVSETLQGLPPGTSIKERRFIYDGSLGDKKQVMDVVNIITITFRAILFYKNGKLFLFQDRPDSLPVAIFNETNILKDTFSISGIDEEELITGVNITYTDPTNHYRQEVLRIDDARALDERNGIENVIDIATDGITRKSQAIRLAQYMIADKKYSRRKVNFKTTSEASELKPGDVISVAQKSASVSWGYGGIVFEDTPSGGASSSNVKLEHISAPALTSTIFTANSGPLALRVASTKNGHVDTYVISNTSYSLSNTANVSGGTEIAEVVALSKWNNKNKSFDTITWDDLSRPKRYDVWSLGEINDPTDIYTSLSGKLFRIINLKRDKEEKIDVEATEYIPAVYTDSDTLINYSPLLFNDLFDPLRKPPAPQFTLRSIPKRDLDGSVYTDIEINAVTDRTGYSNEFRTEYYRSRPTTSLKLISNATPQASRDIVEMNLDNIENVTEGEHCIIYGKNGYSFEFATTRLLVHGYSKVDEAPDKANGNISLSVSGFGGIIDKNFGSDIHVLDVNNTFDFAGLKGNDRISLPINQKVQGGSGDAAGLLGFIGSDTRLARYSANAIGFDKSAHTIKIDNDHSGASQLVSLLPDPPFYINVPQIIDHRFFANNTLYVTGNYLEVVRTNVATTTNLFETHTFKQPLGISVRHSGFVDVFLNNEATTNFTLEKGLDNLANSQVSISLSSLPTLDANIDIRVTANVYTPPIIERGDNVTWNVGNTYGISDTTFDIGAPSYNAYLTANGIFRVTLDDNIKSNVAQAYAINVTPNPIGLVGNLNVGAKTFTFDYDHTRFPGLLNLANNAVYRLNVPLDNFTPLDFDSGTNTRYIHRAEAGVHAVRARNVNKFGRRSDFVQKDVVVRNIPIKAVSNLNIIEEIYKDSTIGVAVRAIIVFDHIEGQEVTDYEISYKITGTATGDLTSFNTVKVSSAGVDSDGKIRFKIDNIEKGLNTNPNAVTARITPLNKNIRGSTVAKTQEIIGKLAPPQNVLNFAAGQASDTLVFVWKYQIDPVTGDNIDLDLMEVQIRRVSGQVATDQANLLDLWPRSDEVAIVDARTNRVVVDIDQFGQYTYLARTKDTSGIFSETIVASTFTSIAQAFTNVYRAYNEDSPGTAVVAGITNANDGETNFPSFADSNTGGLAFAKADSDFDSSVVDNSNGTSSGWSVISGSPTDLRALSDAVYQTQIRDLGNTITGSISATVVGDQSLKSTWLDYTDQIGGDQVTEASSGAGILKDIDFSGTLGIGEILGSSNTGAATVTYGVENKTLVSGVQGSFPSNVFGIVTLGNFDGDDSNANVFSLIAGVSSDDEIVLGESWYANGRSTGSNGFSNLTVAGTSYKLVNLKQWLDLSESSTFYGTVGIVTSNLLFRYSTDTPFYANGNVNVSVFTTVANSDGFSNFVTGARTFRYFQFRYEVINTDPTQAELLLDQFRYQVSLDEKTFTEIVTVDTQVVNVDYSQMGYTQIPKITSLSVSASSNQIALPQAVILDRGLQGANISVYFANGASAHNILTPDGTSDVITPQVDFAVTGV